MFDSPQTGVAAVGVTMLFCDVLCGEDKNVKRYALGRIAANDLAVEYTVDGGATWAEVTGLDVGRLPDTETELESLVWTYAHSELLTFDTITRVADVTEGTAQTALACETWGREKEIPSRPTDTVGRAMNFHAVAYFDHTPSSDFSVPWRANSFRAGGAHVAYCDGSVHFISDVVDYRRFCVLAAFGGGETFDREEVNR